MTLNIKIIVKSRETPVGELKLALGWFGMGREKQFE